MINTSFFFYSPFVLVDINTTNGSFILEKSSVVKQLTLYIYREQSTCGLLHYERHVRDGLWLNENFIMSQSTYTFLSIAMPHHHAICCMNTSSFILESHQNCSSDHVGCIGPQACG